jgi:hypothetical protein
MTKVRVIAVRLCKVLYAKCNLGCVEPEVGKREEGELLSAGSGEYCAL